MEELFLKTLNMSITATYVLIAVLVLRLILKHTPKWISYALWSLVLFRLVCPVSISSAFSVFGKIGKTASTGGGIEYIPADIGMMSTPQVDIGTMSINTVINNALPAATKAASINPMQILISIGACIWLVGLTLMLVYSVVSYRRLKHRMIDATMLSGNIFETDRVSSPFVCGLIKPKIYLPITLSSSERDYVLSHEQTHISRKDYLIKPLAFLVLSVHWFNPFMWLAFLLMSRDIEMSCDEKVVSGLDSEGKTGYSTALMRLAMKRPILAGSPLAFGESGAKGRIKNVLNYKKPASWITAVALVVVAVAGIVLLTNPNTIHYNGINIDISPFTYVIPSRIVESPDKQHTVLVEIYKISKDSDSTYIMGTLGTLDDRKGYTKDSKIIFWQKVDSNSIKEQTINGESLDNWIDVAWLDEQNINMNGISININNVYDYRRDQANSTKTGGQ